MPAPSVVTPIIALDVDSLHSTSSACAALVAHHMRETLSLDILSVALSLLKACWRVECLLSSGICSSRSLFSRLFSPW